uniref:Uncharacterized protein n=1 Tax=Panagrolaimus sp. ES5 TaxID=591445 RepID=A0AC34FDT1_9BILA
MNYGLSVRSDKDAVEQNTQFIGTRGYAPLRSHCYLDQQKDDDYESLSYILVDLISPVDVFECINDVDTAAKMKRDLQNTREIFCDLPPQMKKFYEEIIRTRALPKYELLIGFIVKSAEQLNFDVTALAFNHSKEQFAQNMKEFREITKDYGTRKPAKKSVRRRST